jgi:CDP-6-deoxy-D-xylo-4-hexulose-3-dehydrase
MEVNIFDTRIIPKSSLSATGTVSPATLIRVLRKRITGPVLDFYNLYHWPRDPRQNEMLVPYSGRVFDHLEIQNAIEASLDFWLTPGPWNEELERKLSSFLGVRQTVLTNSGSSANLLAISALRSPLLGPRAIPAGSEVITCATGFPTTINPILQNDCLPVLVDVDPVSGNATTAALRAAVTGKTRAIILAHTLGNPFDLAGVRELCDEYDLWLIEDACDALGSTYDGRPVGSFGDLSTLSFYPAHHITTGEGGAVNIRENPLLARAVLSIRDWGRDCWCQPGQDNVCGKRFAGDFGDLPHGYDHKFVYTHIGYNLKMTDWQAAIGCAQFAKLGQFSASRRLTWQRLAEIFARHTEHFELPTAAPRSDPSWFGFKVMLRDSAPFTRDQVVGFFETNGIQTRGIFGGNVLRQPAYRDLATVGRLRVAGSLTGSDRLMNDAFFIGVYPGIGAGHTDHVGHVLDKFFEHVATGFARPPSRAELRSAARALSPHPRALGRPRGTA